MQDRFKFRVWDKASKKMHEVWGFSKMSVSFGDAKVHSLSRNECVLMQCTGLKDWTGKLIFEGDIVKDMTNKRGVIQWNEYHACFMVVFDDGDNREFGELDLDRVDFEIIGNIHENPELLEDKKDE